MLALFTTACVPAGYDYHYVRIDSPQFLVETTGLSDIREEVVYMMSHTEMPTSYSATRGEYTVNAQIVLDSERPQIEITASDESGVSILVGGRVYDDCFGFFHDDMQHEAAIDEPQSILTYTWARRGFPKCYDRIEPVETEMYFDLRIYSANGAVLGDEKTKFSIRKNGRYYVYDSI